MYIKKNFCEICNGKNNLEIHHIIPRSYGGRDESDNLQTVCNNCHFEIHFGFKPIKINFYKLEFWDIQILRQFYNPCRPWLFPVLLNTIRRRYNYKDTDEAFRKRIKRLVSRGILKLIKGHNPSILVPRFGAKEEVLGAIEDWFMEVHMLGTLEDGFDEGDNREY